MLNLEIYDDKNVYIKESCTLVLKNKNININYNFSNGEYVVLVFNDFDDDVLINETGSINNSYVKINYLQLDPFNLKQNTSIDVNDDSSLVINTTYLATKNKEVVFNLFNKKPNSTVDINNNVVCINDSNFSMDCIGTIVKGAKLSKCHQKNHCLTIDSPKKARILPVLNIDENDVEASHSLSCGTIDDEILFYINSRGLNNSEALNLILRSYLMPNDDYYSDFELGSVIQEKANRKVDQICSM